MSDADKCFVEGAIFACFLILWGDDNEGVDVEDEEDEKDGEMGVLGEVALLQDAVEISGDCFFPLQMDRESTISLLGLEGSRLGS